MVKWKMGWCRGENHPPIKVAQQGGHIQFVLMSAFRFSLTYLLSQGQFQKDTAVRWVLLTPDLETNSQITQVNKKHVEEKSHL